MTRSEFINIFGECPFEMVCKGYKFTDTEIQKITNHIGWTVAHIMAWKSHQFTDPEILKLVDDDGDTVAHIMAWKSHQFTDPEILNLEILNLTDGRGRTIKDIME